MRYADSFTAVINSLAFFTEFEFQEPTESTEVMVYDCDEDDDEIKAMNRNGKHIQININKIIIAP